MQLSRQIDHRSMEKPGIIGLFCVILFLSAFMRFRYIENRPVHTDEAENASILALDIQGESYRFNPTHHHGPTLNYLLRITSKVHKFNNFRDMDMGVMRAWIAATALLTLGIFWVFRPIIGSIAVIVATISGGFSVLLIYYSNYVIHETLMGCFAIGLLGTSVLFIQHPGKVAALGIGIFVGLLLSTKITSLILIASWSIALMSLLPGGYVNITKTCTKTELASYALLISLMTGAICITFYSSFFQNFGGLPDALSSLFVYHTESGHDKPWHYYLSHFLLPHPDQVISIHESPMLILALLGMIRSIQKRFSRQMDRAGSFGFFLTVSVICQLLLYSSISYKTPWLMVVSWLHIALLSGIGFNWIWDKRGKITQAVIICLFLTGICYQVNMIDRIMTRFHSDVRNPLAYSPTSSNIENLPYFLSRLPAIQSVDVYGEFIWPLPWYLRELNGIRYFTETEVNRLNNVLVLTDASYASLKSGIRGKYQIFPYTLRPNFPIYLCVENSLWEEWESNK